MADPTHSVVSGAAGSMVVVAATALGLDFASMVWGLFGGLVQHLFSDKHEATATKEVVKATSGLTVALLTSAALTPLVTHWWTTTFPSHPFLFTKMFIGFLIGLSAKGLLEVLSRMVPAIVGGVLRSFVKRVFGEDIYRRVFEDKGDGDGDKK